MGKEKGLIKYVIKDTDYQNSYVSGKNEMQSGLFNAQVFEGIESIPKEFKNLQSYTIINLNLKEGIKLILEEFDVVIEKTAENSELIEKILKKNKKYKSEIELNPEIQKLRKLFDYNPEIIKKYIEIPKKERVIRNKDSLIEELMNPD